MSRVGGTPTKGRGWTTAADIAAEVRRLWDNGRILAARIDGPPLFPMRTPLRRPTAAQIGDHFDEVRAWIRDLDAGSSGGGYAIEWTEVTHRQLGRNRVPRGITVTTEADAISLIGVARDVARFDQLAAATRQRAPALLPWVARRPFVALSHADDWPRLLDVVFWFLANPRSNLYVRQLDIGGIDSKFVEDHRAILSELLDVVAPDAWPLGVPSGSEHFHRRYGLRSKPTLVRFRMLDPSIRLHGVSDLTIPAAELAQLSLGVERVFVAENEINGLAFPDMPRALVIFGLGYAVDLLRESEWLARTELCYWGDIDTHGFVMLDRIRGMFPHVRSVMMDRATLLEHRALWVREQAPTSRSLDRLSLDEAALYEDLVEHRLGECVRLEQERIGYRWVVRALGELSHEPAASSLQDPVHHVEALRRSHRSS